MTVAAPTSVQPRPEHHRSRRVLVAILAFLLGGLAVVLLYQFDVDDASAFTRPWKGELTMTRSSGPIYEYACHEANYSLTNLLRGSRASERRN